MKHKCAENGNDHQLETASDGKWYLNRHWAISFCPYCGEKLEPPDEKIEINEQILWGANKRLQKARQLLWGHPREASDLIYGVIEEITGAIHGND